MPLLLFLLVAAAALPSRARASSTDWELLAELGGGLDGNALRAAAPDPAEVSPFLAASALARGTVRDGGLRATAALAGALRVHPAVPDADAFASRLEAEGSAALGGRLAGGLALSASDLSDRAGRLARGSLRGTASLTLGGSDLGLALLGGWSRFAPRDPVLRSLTASGPEVGLRGWWSPATRHAVTLSGTVWRQDFPRWDPVVSRTDDTWIASLAYAYRGPVLGALGCEASWNRSGVPGGDYSRQRLTGRLATRLPLEATLALRLALQRSHYPAPLRLRDELLVAEGGEGQDLAELRVSRRLGEAMELSAAVAHYRSEAARGSGAPSFRRTVASVLLGWRARSEDGD